MRPESPKLLEDVRVAATFVIDKTRNMDFDGYRADEVLRLAVERQFEIIGEGLIRLRRFDTETLDRIQDHSQIIAFRNVLIHGYDAIDHRRVWDAIKNSLPQLHATVLSLLSQAPPEADS